MWYIRLGGGEMRCHPTTRPLWYEGGPYWSVSASSVRPDVNLAKGLEFSGMPSWRGSVAGLLVLTCRRCTRPRVAARRRKRIEHFREPNETLRDRIGP